MHRMTGKYVLQYYVVTAHFSAIKCRDPFYDIPNTIKCTLKT